MTAPAPAAATPAVPPAPVVDAAFWRGRRVLVTGHTGFKGGWLALWLHRLGAAVAGFALDPPTAPSLFEAAGVAAALALDRRGDVRDLAALRRALADAAPEVVFHLAAQPIVRRSYAEPVETFATNVLGTVHLLEAVRHTPSVRAVVIVTSDKCYENREWPWGYRETEPMGGFDPYSSSKGCAELVTAAWRRSYFPPERYGDHGVALASARAGNVIGGGDWAADRLVPDMIRAFLEARPVVIRSPHAIRPWQHVLEPLAGYLRLAERLHRDGPAFAPTFADGWNFGPDAASERPVRDIVDTLATLWGDGARWEPDGGAGHPHEASYLKLDSSCARGRLGWTPRWTLEAALAAIVAWFRAYQAGGDLHALTLAQIARYSEETTP